jgi:hypothetical protein
MVRQLHFFPKALIPNFLYVKFIAFIAFKIKGGATPSILQIDDDLDMY